jgi:hypothetical protein
MMGTKENAMANSPTPEAVARAILDLFKARDSRPGDVMLGNSIVGLQANYGFRGKELEAGLIFAGDQGWIENAPNSAIRLTEAGFAAM